MSGLLNLSSPQLGSGHLDEGVPPPPPDSGQEDPVPIGESLLSIQVRYRPGEWIVIS